MAGHEITCDIDRFASGIAELIGDVPELCGGALEKSVRKAVRETASKLRGEFTGGIGVHPWSEEYRGGFSSHVDRGGLATVGQVGNKNKPGLVHLLEKGHVTPAGRRTRSFPHMDPAFTDMESGFVEDAKAEIMRALA